MNPDDNLISREEKERTVKATLWLIACGRMFFIAEGDLTLSRDLKVPILKQILFFCLLFVLTTLFSFKENNNRTVFVCFCMCAGMYNQIPDECFVLTITNQFSHFI